MAGGKETPRQKMIGMMYLVLTALLALQVQSAVILKFKFIDDSLLDVNDKTAAAAGTTLSSIEAAVKKNTSTKHDVNIFKQGEAIRAKTKETIDYLREVRDKLVVAGGNPKGATEYKDINADNIVARVMVGGDKKDGLAYPLKNKLNEYSLFLKSQMYSKSVGKPEEPLLPGATALALDAKEDIRVTGSKERSTLDQKSKDFAELNFESTPLAAALATLSQKETEVLKYESEALQKLAAAVGAETIVFDKIGAFASAESQTVAAGTKYKAELFLTASSKDLKQSMSLNGSPLSIDAASQHGKIEFTAKPGSFDRDGNAKASWTGAIRLNRGGRDTTYKITVPYTVTKPVMEVQSASVQALYLKCGNELRVSVPALGAMYNPSFSASGASVIRGEKKGEVTLVPNSKEVTLSVSSSGNAIGSQTFRVRPIPMPTIECYAGSGKADEKIGIPSGTLRYVSLRAVPDAGFAAFLPKDARYRVARFEITLARGSRPVAPTQPVNGAQIDMSNYANMARAGDRLFIEVRGVQRQNFQGQVEDIPMTRVFNVPLR